MSVTTAQKNWKIGRRLKAVSAGAKDEMGRVSWSVCEVGGMRVKGSGVVREARGVRRRTDHLSVIEGSLRFCEFSIATDVDEGGGPGRSSGVCRQSARFSFGSGEWRPATNHSDDRGDNKEGFEEHVNEVSGRESRE